MGRNDTESDDIPLLEYDPLKIQVRAFAPREGGAGVAALADGGFGKRAEVAAAGEGVLDTLAPKEAEVAGPLSVDFAFEVEGATFVGEVARYEDEDEGDPEEEVVDGEEGAVVEEKTGPADEGGDEAYCGG